VTVDGGTSSTEHTSTLVFLHGFGDTAEAWRELAELLVRGIPECRARPLFFQLITPVARLLDRTRALAVCAWKQLI